MLYRRFRPASPLCDVVEFVWCLRDGPTHSTERILPAGTAELVVNLRDDAITIGDGRQPGRTTRFSGAVLSGPYTRSFDIDAGAHTCMLGIHFKPGGAQAIIPMPLTELTNAHADLTDIWGPAARSLQMQIGEAETDTARLATLQGAVLSRRRTAHELRQEVFEAVNLLTAQHAPPRIGDLAARCGLTHRRLIKTFTENIGMTPKLFSRMHRFRRTLRRIECVGTAPWARLAAENGYSDQSHMIREFQAFSGLTPVEHLSSRGFDAKDDHVAVGA